MSDEQKTFANVNEVIARRLASFGWDEQMVGSVTDAICFAIAQEYGGRAWYVPKRNGEVKKRIREEFTGRNIQELSRRYGYSASTVRRLVAK